MAYGVSLDACSSCSVLARARYVLPRTEKFIGENKHFRFLLNCIKNVWLVGVVTQNFRPHTHLAIPFYTSAPPPSKSHSYTYDHSYTYNLVAKSKKEGLFEPSVDQPLNYNYVAHK